jgi:hypothetical protein
MKDEIMSKGYAVVHKNLNKLPYRFRQWYLFLLNFLINIINIFKLDNLKIIKLQSLIFSNFPNPTSTPRWYLMHNCIWFIQVLPAFQ